MANPFVGEIRMFGGNFAPAGWMFCDGSTLPISEYETLFNLIGTTYGGDGQQSFALPDLRGRLPMHQGQSPGSGGHTLGEIGGVEDVTLMVPHLPAHSHQLSASSTVAVATAGPSGVLAASSSAQYYGSGQPTSDMAAVAITSQGGSQPHSNMAPFQTVSFIISLFGIYPSQA
ncbi:phage tail protein [Paucibacter sp. KBW04]|uniref:phage tail protein n=1 Tax=Paucibacter sp. KBW04 TaxID=2153361 RepID=UPI000F588C66|nr:tail fiber protein [Paucibacter sp. KBW04]RQO63029.1 phage tail protein [Paucibacter sp. KBW04]